MDALRGMTALVTGAASGIGRAIASHAAAEGACLVLGDIDERALGSTAQELERCGALIVAERCDVTRPGDVQALVAAGVQRFGHIDVAFANAGIEGRLCAPWEHDDEEFTRVLNVNVSGAWRTMKAVLPAMVARGKGAIVATSSAAGLVGAAGLAPYVTSKHAVIGLVRSVSASVAASGVRVNALCPGMVGTSMLDRLVDAEPALNGALLASTPMGRLGTVDEIAAAAIWLASDAASFVTGAAMSVDGGYTSQ